MSTRSCSQETCHFLARSSSTTPHSSSSFLMAVCKGMVPASSTLRWSVQHYFQVSQDIREIFIWDCRSCSGHQKISQELFNVSLSPPVFIGDSEIIPKMIAKIDSAGPPVFYGSRLRDILCVLTRQLVQVSWTSTLIHKSCRTLNPQLPGTQSRPPSSSALPLPQKQLLPPTSWITSSTNPWTVSITSQTIRPILKFHWSARRVSLQSVLCLMHTPNWTLPRYPPSSLSHRIQVLYPWSPQNDQCYEEILSRLYQTDQEKLICLWDWCSQRLTDCSASVLVLSGRYF